LRFWNNSSRRTFCDTCKHFFLGRIFPQFAYLQSNVLLTFFSYLFRNLLWKLCKITPCRCKIYFKIFCFSWGYIRYFLLCTQDFSPYRLPFLYLSLPSLTHVLNLIFYTEPFYSHYLRYFPWTFLYPLL